MPRRYITAKEKEIIAERAGNVCEYCRSRADFAHQSFSIEHIIPVSLAGPTELDNLALACPGCNSFKSDKTEASDPADGKTAPLFHPRKQNWNDHFEWSDDCLNIIGLIPTGRATVATLRLNRPGLVNIRLAMLALGLYPPI
jgi:hypothetical protein